MFSCLRASLALAFTVVLATPSLAAAQQDNVGRIERIAEILGGQTEREIRATTPKVQIRRAGSEAWVNAAPRAPVSRNQNILVQRWVDARLQVEGGAHRGQLVLLPELMRRGGGRVFPQAAGQQVEQGVYGIGTQPGRADELTVAVDRGALVVDWVHGRLVVVAGGTRTVITGTRVAFSTEEDGESGYLFLEEGGVSFPDHPEVRVAPGDLVHLRRGLAPVVVPIAAMGVETIREAMHYHNRVVWARSLPFWRKPMYYLPTAAVVGGIVIAAVWPRERDASVTIQFPPQDGPP